MKRSGRIILKAGVLAGIVGVAACSGDSPTAIGAQEGGGQSSSALPAAFGWFSDDVEAYVDGDYIVLRSNGVPNHSSPYFDTSDSRYAVYSGENPDFQLNPNRIREQQFTFRIPLAPTEASVHAATPLGPIGIAVNGVAIFNQYAGPSQPLTFEIDSFDQYNGHPQQTGVYHYHVEPVYLTAAAGPTALLGFLLDGFPVYGPEEDGRQVSNADLDDLHGHFGATADYPEGIYHYHVTAEDPYINGAGFYGTPGTVSG
jgi:hypothetical protein